MYLFPMSPLIFVHDCRYKKKNRIFFLMKNLTDSNSFQELNICVKFCLTEFSSFYGNDFYVIEMDIEDAFLDGFPDSV